MSLRGRFSRRTLYNYFSKRTKYFITRLVYFSGLLSRWGAGKTPIDGFFLPVQTARLGAFFSGAPFTTIFLNGQSIL